jgi:glycogen debranching enzyme
MGEDRAAAFFEELVRLGRVPALAEVQAALRLDLAHAEGTDHWLIEVNRGDIAVSREEREADAVVRTSRAFFDRLVRGEAHALAGLLRGEIVVEGDLQFVLTIGRMLPEPVSGARRSPAIPAAVGMAMAGSAVRILDGNTFVLSDDRGDVEPSSTSTAGLYSFDTRFLSTWVLSVNGERLTPLAVDDLQYFEARFFLVPTNDGSRTDSELSIVRERSVAGGFDERLTILNYGDRPAALSVRLDADSDFADVFEIKGMSMDRPGRRYKKVEEQRLRLGYERHTFHRETTISTSFPAHIDEHGLTFFVNIEPRGRWTTDLAIRLFAPGPGGDDVRQRLYGYNRGAPQVRQSLEEWLKRTPHLACDCEPLSRTYHRSIADLAALRYSPVTFAGQFLPAAGLPWFMTILGRDSIIASYQALPFASDLAATTLQLLATLQGSTVDQFRNEAPGKILHELRYGEAAAFEAQPYSPYFGSADVTPLFVVLLDEYERWTGNVDLVRRLEPNARAALLWIDEHADLAGDGYVWYRQHYEDHTGENQCWKSAPNAISYRDGRLPGAMRATCELQGYAYDAKRRAARLAREVWHDPEYANELERQAADLKRRFNRDYWIDDGKYFALALEPGGKQVDALASNIGHLMWSGIVEPDRAQYLADHLLGPDLFSGWGVRTLAQTESRYNPIGYHVGTIWPFDNSLIAAGLRRYGYKAEAARIAAGMLDAAGYFRGRLPEAFGGYDRASTRFPVPYLKANSPQAWSTGAPLLLLRTMLGLEPVDEYLVVDPALPASIGRLQLLDIHGRWGQIDAFGRGLIDVDGDHPGQSGDEIRQETIRRS